MATLQTTETRPSGDSHADGKAYFETDTNKMLVWNATAGAWIELDSDGTGAGYVNRWGASFDGSYDYLTVPHDDSLSLLSAGTFSAWINLDSSTVTDYPYIFSKWSGSQYNYTFFTQVVSQTTGYYRLRYWDGSTAFSSSTDIPKGEWVHVAATIGGGSLNFYVNGSPDGTASMSTGTAHTGDLYIGISPANTRAFKGSIDDAAFFNTVLSAPDISKIYNGTAPNGKPTDLTLAASYDTDRTSNLVGYWRMGDDSNDTATSGESIATITDSSGNGNDAAQSDVTKQPTFADLTGETIYS